MTVIRKNAALLAVVAVLMACIAAPYMIPENPDSSIFRNGSLGFILLLACVLPLKDALIHANTRQLAASLLLGYLFALALSLGSELFVYDGLLRGFGSFVRRMAVPVLAAPLFAGICCRLMQQKNTCAHKHTCTLPTWCYALIIFLCWSPLVLAYYPAMLNYDFAGQYFQHLAKAYSSIHPLLHSAVMNGIITLGEAIHSRTIGVLLYCLMQMLIFAFSLGYSCTFVQRRGAPAIALVMMTALYALHPVFSAMALSMTKDTLFAVAILVLSLLTWEIIESPDEFLSSKKRCFFYVFCCINAALMRNNGIFALVFLLPGLVMVLRGFRKRAALLTTVSVLACLLTNGILTVVLSPETLPSFQLYSIPAQQLVRAYNSGTMSAEDQAEIAEWYTHPAGLVVHSHLADGAKGYLDRPRIQAEGSEFLSIWAKHFKNYAHEYLEAFLMLNVGSWYPDDLSHSTIYPDASWNDKGYLQTQEADMLEYGIESTSYLPKVRNFYERICRRNEYQKYPIISILFCTATPFWVLMFASTVLFARKHTRYILVPLGCFGLWLSYLFGPCTLARYMLPLFCLAPVLLILAFSASDVR